MSPKALVARLFVRRPKSWRDPVPAKFRRVRRQESSHLVDAVRRGPHGASRAPLRNTAGTGPAARGEAGV